MDTSSSSQRALLFIGNNLVECLLRPHLGGATEGIAAEAVKGAIAVDTALTSFSRPSLYMLSLLQHIRPSLRLVCNAVVT
jgi:hypothetical protein